MVLILFLLCVYRWKGTWILFLPVTSTMVITLSVSLERNRISILVSFQNNFLALGYPEMNSDTVLLCSHLRWSIAFSLLPTGLLFSQKWRDIYHTTGSVFTSPDMSNSGWQWAFCANFLVELNFFNMHVKTALTRLFASLHWLCMKFTRFTSLNSHLVWTQHKCVVFAPIVALNRMSWA